MPKSFLLYICLPYQFIHSPSVLKVKCCFYFYIMVSIYILVYISKTLYFKTCHHPLALSASYSLSSPSAPRYQPSPETCYLGCYQSLKEQTITNSLSAVLTIQMEYLTLLLPCLNLLNGFSKCTECIQHSIDLCTLKTFKISY